jgi:hypothetical protein
MFNDHPHKREETQTFYILFGFFPVRVVNLRLVAAWLHYGVLSITRQPTADNLTKFCGMTFVHFFDDK